MANIKSQKKRIRTNERDRQRNLGIRSRMKTYIKKAFAAIESPEATDRDESVRTAISEIDRACSKGVIHRNQAARKKSALHRAAAESN